MGRVKEQLLRRDRRLRERRALSNRLERIGDGLRTLGALRRLLLKKLQHEVLERPRQAHKVAEAGRRRGEDRVNEVTREIALVEEPDLDRRNGTLVSLVPRLRRFEGAPARDQLERDDPQRVEIRGRRDRASSKLFRRRVRKRSFERTVVPLTEQSRDAEVEELRHGRAAPFVEVNEDIVRLEILMNDSGPVRGVERVADVDENVERVRHLETLLQQQELAPVASVEELHLDERSRTVAAGHPCCVHLDDVPVA